MTDMVGTVFREARSKDLPGILRLLEQLHSQDPPLEPRVAAASFEAILVSPGLSLFVIEEERAILATAYLNVIPNLTRGGQPYAIVENVVVDEAHRGRGLGKLLMAGALTAAWEAGCYKAMLQTGSKQPRTHAFYRACGFSADEKHAYIAHP